MNGDVEKLSELLSSINITIRDENGNFKPMMGILCELAEVWDSVSDGVGDEIKYILGNTSAKDVISEEMFK